MRIKFCKMHSLGNDFMVMSRDDADFVPTAEMVRAWGDRHRGIGFDQLLFVEVNGTLPVCRIFNADGLPAEQCGNGARCVATYLRDKHHFKSPMKFKMDQNDVSANVLTDGRVSVQLMPPVFGKDAVGFFDVAGESDASASACDLPTSVGVLRFGLVSLGNPHAVTEVTEDDFPVAAVGAEIQAMAAFTRGVNVGFMTVERGDRVRLRVVERGCGETQACGSGACAAMVVGRQRGLLDERVTVVLPGGELAIEWAGGNEPIRMTGPATKVYCGEVEVPL